MSRPGLTPQDVRDVVFPKPPLGGRGYAEDDVDAFLDRLAGTAPGHVAEPAASAGTRPAVSEEPFVESRGFLARLLGRR